MAATGGFAGQLGYKSESTYGTAVTVDTFIDFTSESIEYDVERIPFRGIRAGRRVGHGFVEGRQSVAGSVEFDLPADDIAPLLKHWFGGVNTSGAGPYTHTYSIDDLNDDSFTLQVGRPDVGGTVRPYTWAGCKVASWSLDCQIGELVKASMEVVGQSQTTATALASASYAAANPFVFTHASLSLGGSEAGSINGVTLQGENMLNSDRYHLKSTNAGQVAQPIEAGVRNYSGTIDIEFANMTAYDYFVNGTSNALVLTVSNGTESLTITCNVRYDKPSGPNVSDPDSILSMQLPFVCYHATADNSAIQAVLVNSDTSAA